MYYFPFPFSILIDLFLVRRKRTTYKHFISIIQKVKNYRFNNRFRWIQMNVCNKRRFDRITIHLKLKNQSKNR